MNPVRNQRRIAAALVLVFLYLALNACSQREQPVERGKSAAGLYNVTLHDLFGNQIPFQSFQGKVLVIDFFASWCGPCRETAPVIQSIHERYGAQSDVAVVGVALEPPSSLEAVRLFVKRHGITFPSVIDDGKIREITGVHMVPTTLIIDKDGKAHARIPGARRDLKELIIREIEQLRK